MLALVLARAGDVKQAEQLADSLDGAFPLDTSIQYYCLPTIRAAMKLQASDPAGAIEILRRTEKARVGRSRFVLRAVPPRTFAAWLICSCVRDAWRRPSSRSCWLIGAWWETSVTGALSHVQLARAQRMMGEEAAARKSYGDFLTLWKDADPDIPIYEQAKAEYLELGRTR